MNAPYNIDALRAAARKRKRNSLIANIVIAVLAVPVVLALLALLFVIGGLVTLFGWNIGVVGVAAALGAKVALINLWTAIGANVALGVVGRALNKQPSSVKVDSKA